MYYRRSRRKHPLKVGDPAIAIIPGLRYEYEVVVMVSGTMHCMDAHFCHSKCRDTCKYTVVGMDPHAVKWPMFHETIPLICSARVKSFKVVKNESKQSLPKE